MINLENHTFSLKLNVDGSINQLYVKRDPHRMNWVVDCNYLREAGYPDEDRAFGHVLASINGKEFTSVGGDARISSSGDKTAFLFTASGCEITLSYDLSDNDSLLWSIEIRNCSNKPVNVDAFSVWFSLAYVMFRDHDTLRNRTASCAVFPSLSDHYSKFLAVKRDGRGPNLGIYQMEGQTVSFGSYCRYENKFLEEVSPSLDGVIYHQLVLGDSEAAVGSDWIYGSLAQNKIKTLKPNGKFRWSYWIEPVQTHSDFYAAGLKIGHPSISFSPITICGGLFEAEIKLPPGRTVSRLYIEHGQETRVEMEDIVEYAVFTEDTVSISKTMRTVGEKKLVIELDDRTTDFAVFSVLESTREILEARVNYLCQNSFNEQECAFEPLSNQGESLGKLCLILQKNLLADKRSDQIRKVEKSASQYITNKWFKDGDFTKPKKNYDGFYRIFDFDYIAHVFFLLSKFDDSDLVEHSAHTYLEWAAHVMITRFDGTLHAADREKKETLLTGVFTLYLPQLIDALKTSGLLDLHKKLNFLWQAFSEHLSAGAETYQGVITEHYFDNAGFGPTCEALCLSGKFEEATKYGELILANIGISNDYRAQNPDRWWEALSYMLHSLWGGLVSNSSLIAYEYLRETDYLLAAYRSMMPLFFCYDWNAYSTQTRLQRGEAASTYCVTSPNLNKPRLSHNRFGQSVFLEDGAVFGNATGDDWDMGEEMAAYLNGFGTKTFLYMDGDKVKCVNGFLREENGKTVITSFAAYPKSYYFFDRQLVLHAADGELLQSIVLDEKGLHPLLDAADSALK